MPKNLNELIETLNKAYPDDFLALQHAEFSKNLETLSLTEALAAYVVREIEELYDPSSSERQNAVRTAPSLARSADVLQQLAEVLRQESKAN